MIIKIATMHGESHLTFTMGWIRVLKVSLKSRSPRFSPAATAHGQGRPFATKLAMMSESIKENERMKVMMAFQKKEKKNTCHVLSVFCVSKGLISFTSSDD